MDRLDFVFRAVSEMSRKGKRGVSAMEVCGAYSMDRANVSRYLNKLHKQGRIERIEGRPVRYYIEESLVAEDLVDEEEGFEETIGLEQLVGYDGSLQIAIQQAKAAMLYPSGGLHVLLLGETGVGKSLFAEALYHFSKKSKVLKSTAPFIRFNCADYADNPQLVMAHIFGVKKGAYTGADNDRTGLIKQADQGVLFLDEIHRLSPQGQEMLFTYIDKGIFRKLGETDKVEKAQVRIIAATTEDPDSYLLKTFTRRIPMTIMLPSLKERGLKERYSLIDSFIRQESKRIGKSIYVNRDSLISYLLYDCNSNIGQLRSDIQLACAKAFLTYKAQNENYILIQQSDLPQHVKKGLMKLQSKRSEVHKLLAKKGDILRFYYKEKAVPLVPNTLDAPIFYNHIESRIMELKSDGLEDKEINQIMNIDIEKHFQNFMGKLPNQVKRDDVLKVVDQAILQLAEAILDLASDKLNKQYDEKVQYGLALHLQGSLERIRKGSRIYHPKLNLIRVQYADAFLVAMEAAKLIDSVLGMEVPLDEIGYLTMFLISDSFEAMGEEKSRVGVMVVMHGKSTATSMVQVANHLLGVEHARALNMPMSMKPEEIYKRVVSEAQVINQGQGILLLVDMGSLTNFSDMLYEDTGIPTQSISHVSTPVVIEASRKAIQGQELKEIYQSCKDFVGSVKPFERKTTQALKNLIVTACFTGEGASEKLKEMIQERIQRKDLIEIRSLNILNHKEFLKSLDHYKTTYNLMAVVGTIDIELEDIPFISAIDILSGIGLEQLDIYINKELVFERMAESLNEHLSKLEARSLIQDIRRAIIRLEKHLSVTVSDEVKQGIMLHMCFMVDKMASGGKETLFKELDLYREKYSMELELTYEAIQFLEIQYNITIGVNERAYLTKMFIENNQKIK